MLTSNTQSMALPAALLYLSLSCLLVHAKKHGVPFTSSITINGEASDWAEPIPHFHNHPFTAHDGATVTFETAGGAWSGPTDHTTSLAFAWDVGNLYVLATVLDDEHIHTGGGGYNFVWDGDSMQMLFTDAAQTEVISMYNVALYDDRTMHIQHEQHPSTDTVGLEMELAIVRDDAMHLTTYEVRIPAQMIGFAAFKEGAEFGIAVAVNDGDFPPSEQGQRGWSGLHPDAIVYSKEPAKAQRLVLKGARYKAKAKGKVLGKQADEARNARSTVPAKEEL